jgi:valyl-tRNA synthetase
METLPSKYEPQLTENKWYNYWMENGFFNSTPDGREPYTVVIPPPNVTGVLHMGHMLNNTIQDVLVRRARMMGKNACWVPGTDHASIATEAKVVAKLASEGINKNDLTREEFLQHAWEWTEKHGGIILQQLKKLGASCDWSRTRFTMDKSLSDSVYKVFVDLYKKGKIYRGMRMVNWDPKAKTALSDEEVNHKEVQSKLYYIKYQIGNDKNPTEPTDQYILIATTRPETILGDTAICVNPEDERYRQLHGRYAIVPLIGRAIPIITDSYVDMQFGTGALKITPAHDPNDYLIGQKYNLDTIDIFNDDGTLNEAAQLYVGMDRFDVRKAIEKDIAKANLLEKVENHINKVGYSERTDVPIEPRMSTQWFISMERLAVPALRAVMEDVIKIYPAKFKSTYKHWMENIQDWCISRQLWWGHRIPAWYLPNGSGIVVAENEQQALELAKIKSGNENLKIEDLQQDEDCLDTWFSSWLWPISVFDGINNPQNEDIKYYYPTNDLVTAPEILFFWVARMIMAGYEYTNEKPFKNVYLTGIVRDKLGRKMSKQLGNSPDPLELIEKYSADAVRLGMLLTSPAGNDLPFDEQLCEQGKFFNNKIWNAFRLVKGWKVDENQTQTIAQAQAIEWFDALLNKTIEDIDQQMSKYRLSDALMTIYKLFWDEFSAWYLEMIKPKYQQPIDCNTYNCTLDFFDKLMRLLHPFMPFITEELWQHIRIRQDGQSIMMSEYPTHKQQETNIIADFDILKEIITMIRNVRQEKNIPNKEELSLLVGGTVSYTQILSSMCNLNEVKSVTEKPQNAVQFMVGVTEYFVPISKEIDKEEETKKLEAELAYQKGFLQTVMKKLDNEKFIASAPEKVIAIERKKQADANDRIRAIEEQLRALI